MGKGTVKIYGFNNDGEYELHHELNRRQYTKKSKLISTLNEDTVQAKDLQDELYGNPFLVKLNVFNRNYISTIEDFYLKVGDNYFTFGSILRGSCFNKREKKKIIKNQIKYWIDEADEEIKSTLNGSKETISIGYNNNFVKVNFIYQFLLSLGIIIPIVLLLNVIPIFDCSNKVYLYVGIGVIVLSILGLLLSIFQNQNNRNFKKNVDDHRKLHNQFSSKIVKKFNKNKRRLKWYYSFGYKENKFNRAQYPISKVQIGGDKLSQIQISSQDIDKKSKTLISKKEIPNFKYYVSIILAYLCAGICITYILVNVIIYLIKLCL